MSKIYIKQEDFCFKCDWCPDVNGFCAYIIKCYDGTLYKGSTSNLKRRVQQHFNNSGSKYTKGHIPYSLLHFEVFDTLSEAIRRELFFKKDFGWIKDNLTNFNEIIPH